MAKETKVISLVVCFLGHNHRIAIDPQKCTVNKATKSFTYKARYTADDGKYYMVKAVSVNGSEGTRANVTITNYSGKQIIAERSNVGVRFSRYLF